MSKIQIKFSFYLLQHGNLIDVTFCKDINVQCFFYFFFKSIYLISIEKQYHDCVLCGLGFLEIIILEWNKPQRNMCWLSHTCFQWDLSLKSLHFLKSKLYPVSQIQGPASTSQDMFEIFSWMPHVYPTIARELYFQFLLACIKYQSFFVHVLFP